MNIFSILDISASGLSAERMRMNVIANNLANAQSTESPDGMPYRRQQVEFISLLRRSLDSHIPGEELLGGVKVRGIVKSTEPFNKIYMPGHPKAGKDGMVEVPNVSVVNEMVDMVTASRAYEANLAVMTTSKEMINKALGAFSR
ncbi:MAG TPA: flagellar basal body rod protein FlgC [Candidatus Brocadiia bacterium]|nr:flagellar basal body rod protein FlgC [Planctomycetota bacterium]MBI4008107.1 flagellar basal body rod protein FlgC [Planctomycetota bacterium]MDO8092230.1 flagellar basal body rod protein FlgC [Candidatus Brocadiales bacterium]